MRRVVVTGMGVISPIGNNLEDNWNSIKNGVCGIDNITCFDTSDCRVKVAGEIKNLNLEDYFENKKEINKMDRFIALALIAAKEAVDMSGVLDSDFDRNRASVYIGTGTGGLNIIEAEHNRMLNRGSRFISPYFVPGGISNIAAASISIKYNLCGPAYCIETACAAGTNAVGEAFRSIRDGYSDMSVCGGTESCISEFGICSFDAIRTLSRSENPHRASIPFDKERTGFVMGEGAGIMVLEEYEHAKKRGANILCEIAGYGANCDAYHTTAPREDGSGARECMRLAIEDAGIDVSQIKYINAHGTSTTRNDRSEALAIQELFDDIVDNVYVSSTKSMTGHMLGATGAIEAIYTAMTVMNDCCPANIGLDEVDEDCRLNIVRDKAICEKVDYAMSNSFGFGGHNACVVIKKAD